MTDFSDVEIEILQFRIAELEGLLASYGHDFASDGYESIKMRAPEPDLFATMRHITTLIDDSEEFIAIMAFLSAYYGV